MITNVDFTYTEGSEVVLPEEAQDVRMGAFPAAKARFENTLSDLTKERDELKGRVSSLETLLKETENGQAEAMAAAVQMAVSQIKAELLEIFTAQGAEISALKSAIAPLQAKHEAELEAERKKKEQHQTERKEAALERFTYRSFGIDITNQIEYVQSMNPEEIEYVHQELARWRLSWGIPRLAMIMAREQWTKERILQPWF